MDIVEEIHHLILGSDHFRISPISLDNIIQIIDLVESNSFTTSKTRKGDSIIIELIVRNEIDLAQKIRKKTQKIYIDEAAVLGEIKIIEEIVIKDKSIINFRSNFEGFTPLHFAAGFSNSFETVKFLVENGAELDVISGGKLMNSITPVIACVIGGNQEILKYLLDQGANPEIREGNTGFTPFEIAKKNSRFDLASIIANYR